jgi:hypothetical protein
LDALGKTPENYEDTFVCMLLEKFHGEVRKNVERKHYQDELTLEQLRMRQNSLVGGRTISNSPLPHPEQQQQRGQSFKTFSIPAVGKALIYLAGLP